MKGKLGFYRLPEVIEFGPDTELGSGTYYLICASMQHPDNGFSPGDLFVSTTIIPSVISPLLWNHEWALREGYEQPELGKFYDAVMRDRYRRGWSIQIWDANAYVNYLLHRRPPLKGGHSRMAWIRDRLAALAYFFAKVNEGTYRAVLAGSPGILSKNGSPIDNTIFTTSNQCLHQYYLGLPAELQGKGGRYEKDMGSGTIAKHWAALPITKAERLFGKPASALEKEAYQNERSWHQKAVDITRKTIYAFLEKCEREVRKLTPSSLRPEVRKFLPRVAGAIEEGRRFPKGMKFPEAKDSYSDVDIGASLGKEALSWEEAKKVVGVPDARREKTKAPPVAGVVKAKRGEKGPKTQKWPDPTRHTTASVWTTDDDVWHLSTTTNGIRDGELRLRRFKRQRTKQLQLMELVCANWPSGTRVADVITAAYGPAWNAVRSGRRTRRSVVKCVCSLVTAVRGKLKSAGINPDILPPLNVDASEETEIFLRVAPRTNLDDHDRDSADAPPPDHA